MCAANNPSSTPEPTAVTATNEDDAGQARAAFAGAQIAAEWDAVEGGWSTLMRGPGARLAAAGYRLASSALAASDEPGVLTAEDLPTTSSGAFTSERLGALQDALVEGELAPATELRETITLAFDVAFERGVRQAVSDNSSCT